MDPNQMVNAFAFVNAAGQKQFVKWVFEPVGGTAGLTDDDAKAKGPNFLADELRRRVANGATAFDFAVQLAQPGSWSSHLKVCVALFDWQRG
jgi:catalase